MKLTTEKPIGLVVCMPTRGAVSLETMLCLREHFDGYPSKLLTAIRKPVVEARNQLAKEVRELDANILDFDPRYVLWVDDDAWWPAGHVDRAVRILEDRPDVAMVIGAYCGRLAYLPPLAIVTDGKNLNAVNLMVHEPGELIDVHLSGMHWNLVRRERLESLRRHPIRPAAGNRSVPLREPWKVTA